MKTIRKAFKFRLNTTPEIEHRFTQFADASRFIWNKALGINLHRLNNGYPISWLSEMQFWLGIWKSSDELAFLKDVHSQSIQAPLRNLDRAFKDCFDKTQTNKRCPVFKKKGVTIEPLAKLSTGKFCKPISAPEKPFFEPGRARIAIFDSHPH